MRSWQVGVDVLKWPVTAGDWHRVYAPHTMEPSVLIAMIALELSPMIDSAGCCAAASAANPGTVSLATVVEVLVLNSVIVADEAADKLVVTPEGTARHDLAETTLACTSQRAESGAIVCVCATTDAM